MKKVLLTLAVMVAVSALMATTAHAKNEFENGFKTELGAIAARSAVGMGFGIVTGAVYAEPYYVAPVRHTVVIERRVVPPPRWYQTPHPGYLHRPKPYYGSPYRYSYGHHPGPYSRCR